MLYQGIIGGGSSPVEPKDLSPVLLWTNPSPNTAFGAQTVDLDLTEYTGVLVEFIMNINSSDIISRGYIKKTDYDVEAFGAGTGGGHYSITSAVGRCIKVNDNGVIFENGYIASQQNDAMIPVKIYGVKKYVVEPVVGDLLWSNANPTSVLGNTEISGNYSKYKSILVKARANITVDFRSEFNIAKSTTTYAAGICFSNLGVADYYRNIQFTDEKITIQSGHYMTSGTDTLADNAAIPLEIYGIE